MSIETRMRRLTSASLEERERMWVSTPPTRGRKKSETMRMECRRLGGMVYGGGG